MNEIFSNNNNNNYNSNKNGIGTMNRSSNKGMVNVSGIILSGNGPLKSQLDQSPFLKHYISAAIVSVVDINYGGKFGFNETIRKCSNLLKQNELEGENKMIENIMNLIGNDNDDGNGNNMVSIGFDETLYAVNMNVVKFIVLSSGYYKYAIKVMGNDEEHKENKEKIVKQVKFAKNDIEMQEISKLMLNNGDSIEVCGFIKYFDKLCLENNIELKLVGLHSPITNQFAKGLSGCVAVLHYAINLRNAHNNNDHDDEWLSDD